jgi:hypothetical protein
MVVAWIATLLNLSGDWGYDGWIDWNDFEGRKWVPPRRLDCNCRLYLKKPALPGDMIMKRDW